MSKQKNIHQKPKSAAAKQAEGKNTIVKASFVFEKENYILLLAGLAFIILGFVLMIGGGSDDPAVFSDEIFNFRRLTLAPILILIGYALEVYAIMRKPREAKAETE